MYTVAVFLNKSIKDIVLFVQILIDSFVFITIIYKLDALLPQHGFGYMFQALLKADGLSIRDVFLRLNVNCKVTWEL